VQKHATQTKTGGISSLAAGRWRPVSALPVVSITCRFAVNADSEADIDNPAESILARLQPADNRMKLSQKLPVAGPGARISNDMNQGHAIGLTCNELLDSAATFNSCAYPQSVPSGSGGWLGRRAAHATPPKRIPPTRNVGHHTGSDQPSWINPATPRSVNIADAMQAMVRRIQNGIVRPQVRIRASATKIAKMLRTITATSK
jgi:hypothetical protein